MVYNVVRWIFTLNFKDFGQTSHTALLTFLFVLRSQKSVCVCACACVAEEVRGREDRLQILDSAIWVEEKHGPARGPEC